jgi:ethanolamine utilization cobalamin adenosyltransferase
MYSELLSSYHHGMNYNIWKFADILCSNNHLAFNDDNIKTLFKLINNIIQSNYLLEHIYTNDNIFNEKIIDLVNLYKPYLNYDNNEHYIFLNIINALPIQ